MYRHRLWMVLAGAAVAVLLVACGGGGSSDKSATQTASSGASAGSTANSGAPAQATPAAGTTAKSSNSSGGGSVPDVAAITKKFADSTFQATYKVTGSGADLTNGQMLLYKDGQNRFRFDITTTQNGKDVSIIFIQNNDTSAFCLKDAGELAPLLGVNAGQGVCFKSNPNDPNNPVGNLSSTFSDIENADVTVLETSTRAVAGHDASCYRAKDNKTSDISTICFGKNGEMLYVQTEGSDASTIEATDVKSSVNASDFNLPYEVKDFPGFGGSGQ